METCSITLHLLMFLLLSNSGSSIVEAADIEFYEQEGFVDLIYSSENMSTSCQNMPRDILNRARSMKTKYCVYLNDCSNCDEGCLYLRLESGDYPLLPYISAKFQLTPNGLNSWHACDDVSKNYKFKDQRVLLYDNTTDWYPYEDYLLTTANCRNLPDLYRDKAHLVKAPICIMFYSHPDCQGFEQRFDNKEPTVLPVLAGEVDSYKPCNPADIWKVPKLHAKAISFQVSQNLTEVENQAKRVNVDMGSKTTFQNNGSRALTPSYTAEGSINERVAIKRSSTVSVMQDFSTTSFPKVEFTTEIPQQIQDKVSALLPVAYQWRRNASSAEDETYLIETTKKFSIAQDNIQVPACSIYHAESFVKTTRDCPLHYAVTFEVTGEYEGGLSLTVEEIKENLGDEIVYLKDLDSQKVLAKLDSTISMDLAWEAVFNGRSVPIDECVLKAKYSQNG